MSNARPFLDILRDLGQGITHDELSEKLQELVAAVAETGKGGTLSLAITIKPTDSKSGAVVVFAEVKTKPPKPPTQASVFFITPDNNLQRQDPRQATMELREIKTPAVARALA